MKNFTPELIKKAKTAKSASELLALAKENNLELTAEESKTYFEQLNAIGMLSDDELDIVVGGEKSRCPGDDSQDPDAIQAGFAVAVTDGSTCPGCESMLGFTKATSASGDNVGVFCNRCRKWITLKATRDNVKRV